MAEPVFLLLIAPVVAVAIVMLVGFAGCDLVFSLDTPPSPVIQSAVGTSASSIELTWTFVDPVPGFRIEATRLPEEEVLDPIDAPSSPFEVTGLVDASTYRFRVQPVFTDGDPGRFSLPVNGATLTTTFDTAEDIGVPGDQPAAEGFTLVQRIDQGRLEATGVRVVITVRGPSTGSTLINRVYISQPAAAGDPYDAAGDLTPVFDVNLVAGTPPIMVPANQDVRLPPVVYALDELQPLLVAFELTPAIPSTVRFIPVPQSVAEAFFQAGAEAAIADRQPGYTAQDRIYLITRIDVEVA